MKKCSEIKELISLYIDDELAPDERIEFEEHIAACEECKDELDELTEIVGFCRATTEEELPDNFKTELHQKLLEVQKQSEAAARTAFFRSRYFKLFSSVAAVFLLVFLIKGFYDHSLFPVGKAGQSADKANILAETSAEERIQMKAAAPNAANGSGNSMERSGEGGAPQESYYADKGTQAATEIDRSTSGGRETQPGFTVAGAEDSVSRNTTSITVTVDDPDAQVENVKAVAVKSSGLDETDTQLTGNEAVYSTMEPIENGVVLLLNIPSTQLNAFIEALNTDYGQGNVQPEAVVKEDMSVAIGGLLKQSDDLDLAIEKVENTESADAGSAEDLNKLKEQKIEIQNKIDTIRMESDLTNVKVILKKK